MNFESGLPKKAKNSNVRYIYHEEKGKTDEANSLTAVVMTNVGPVYPLRT